MRIRIATLVIHALAEVCTVPVLLIMYETNNFHVVLCSPRQILATPLAARQCSPTNSLLLELPLSSNLLVEYSIE